ncbi:hypothetical protein [Janibacter limosus]|uniref:PKD domain-containing protein n=1 Tax=Janibacter limosus TaxID=53458 RepID=A0A4P6MUD2_9MICO|nr:hypothetical protein [Janibacter limosus]QBF45405.1 hypothetical protein EXU32_03455 [Janibacter limosus]
MITFSKVTASVLLPAAMALATAAPAQADHQTKQVCDEQNNCTSIAVSHEETRTEEPGSEGHQSEGQSTGNAPSGPSEPGYEVSFDMGDYDREAALAEWERQEPGAFDPTTGQPSGPPPCGVLVVPYVYEPCEATPATPGTPTPPRVTIEQVISMAMAKISLPKPDMGSAPCTGVNCKGTVGVPVWFWLEGDQWKTYSDSASAGGLTVSVSAKPSKVVWSLGDGQSVTCTSAGTTYTSSMGWASSPDCGLPNGYTKAGNYTTTATITYAVTFGGDATGSTTVTSTSSEQITVGEYQAVTSKRG